MTWIIYNADETGIYYRALPERTLACNKEKDVYGFIPNKERITAMVAANASGTHRIPLMVIGKSKVPHCFKGCNVKKFP
jgi:hypothetical protein